MEKAKNMKLKWLYVSIIVISIAIGSFGIFSVLNRSTIYDGIKIENFDVSNMSKEEASKMLKTNLEKDLKQKSMTLNYGDKVYKLNLRELGFYYEIDDAIDEAYSVGREGNIFHRLKTVVRTKKYGEEIKVQISSDPSKINSLVNEIAQEINLESKDAVLNFNGGKISVIDEVVGKKVDTEVLKNRIEDNICKLEEIQIPVDDIIPQKTKALLGRINGKISEFSTSFKGSSADRIENIKVAAKAINGKIVMPEEAVSFNDLTGPRIKSNGYKEANVIIGGDFTPGVGGGVCQVSTTVYNSLLLADLEILERHPHSIPAKYVSYGQDAAVSYGHLDLKFKNKFEFPIYLNTQVIGDRLYVFVYGDRSSKNYEIRIKPELVEKVDPKVETIFDSTLKPGEKVAVQQGRTGYKIKTYKITMMNGKEIKRELITSDYYKPRNYIYRVGPIPKPVVNPSTEVPDSNIEDNSAPTEGNDNVTDNE